jgi:hypothetical protein
MSLDSFLDSFLNDGRRVGDLHIDTIHSEISRLETYLKNPGAGRDAAGRSAEAQADHAKLKGAVLELAGEVQS